MTETARAQRNTVLALGFSNPLNLPANAEENSHVKVYGDSTLLTEGPDYTLDGVGDTGDLDAIDGVDVTIDSSVILADLYDTFTVIHDPPLVQDSDLSGGGTLGRVYETGLDAIVRRLQAVGSFLSRALVPPVAAYDVDPVLPFPDPGKALKWNDTGTALENSLADPDSTELTEAAAFAADAAASASDAALSAIAAAASDTHSTAEASAAATSASAAAASAASAAASAGDPAAVLAALAAARVPAGTSLFFNMKDAPTYTLKENGAAVSRATYADLWAALHKETTVTITIATPAVVTWNSHGLVAGEKVRFYNSGGALPTGLTANTDYYVRSTGLTANTFQISATSGGAAINTSGVQSGVHTAVHAPHGYGDGSTTFNVPESRGEFFRALDDGRGVDTGRLMASAQTEMIGPHAHTASTASAGSHSHTATWSASARYGLNASGVAENDFGSADSVKGTATRTLTTTTGGSHTHTVTVNNNSGTENRPRNVPKLAVIKY